MPIIKAYFNKMPDARRAASALKEMGFHDAHLDAADAFRNEYAVEITFDDQFIIHTSLLVTVNKEKEEEVVRLIGEMGGNIYNGGFDE